MLSQRRYRGFQFQYKAKGQFLQVSQVYQEFCSRNLEQALSLERFSRYVEWAGGDKEKALLLSDN